ncbi:VOC family protein [Arthrobacter zhaoguopingii]|uniref:VOC family protein n=1 Tax=Arthrobacter zhaoguopingii TaxID=2681491 RepID=UPI001AEE7C62|nr:VOC family protein [Arthrobacter zhaoguopingii]
MAHVSADRPDARRQGQDSPSGLPIRPAGILTPGPPFGRNPNPGDVMSTQLPPDPSIPPHQDGRKLIQLCFVVPDLASGMAYFSATFGAGPWFLGPEPADQPGHFLYRGKPRPLGARIALAYAGEMMYELVCPEPGSQSIFTEWAAEHDYGLHHFGFAVHDYDATVRALEVARREILFSGETPRGARIAMVEGTGPLRALEEFIEIIPASANFYTFMRGQAAVWNRSELLFTGKLPMPHRNAAET